MIDSYIHHTPISFPNLTVSHMPSEPAETSLLEHSLVLYLHYYSAIDLHLDDKA